VATLLAYIISDSEHILLTKIVAYFYLVHYWALQKHYHIFSCIGSYCIYWNT